MGTAAYPVLVILWLLSSLYGFRYTDAVYFGPNFGLTKNGSTHTRQDTFVVTFNNPSHVLETGCLTEFRYFAHADGLMAFIITQPMTTELNQIIMHVTEELEISEAASLQTYYVDEGFPVNKGSRFGFIFYPKGNKKDVPLPFDANTSAILYEVKLNLGHNQPLVKGTSLRLTPIYNHAGYYRLGVDVDLTDTNCTSRRSSTTPVTGTSYSSSTSSPGSSSLTPTASTTPVTGTLYSSSTSSPASSSLTPTASTNPAPQNETLMYAVIGGASGATVLIALIILVTVIIIRRSRTAKSGNELGPDGGLSNLSLDDMPTPTGQTSVAPHPEGDQDMYSKPVKRITNTPDVIPSQLAVTPNELYEESVPPIPAKSDDIESSMPVKEESSTPSITINGDDAENTCRTSDYTPIDDNGDGSNVYNEYSTGCDADYADYGNNTHDYDDYDVETRPREHLGAELYNDYERVSRAASGEYSYCDVTPSHRTPSFSSNQYEMVS